MSKIKNFFYVNWLNIFLVLIMIACSLFIYSISNSIFDFYKLNNNIDGLISANATYCKIMGSSFVDFSEFIASDQAEKINVFIESDTKALKAYEVILLNNHPFDNLSGCIFTDENFISGEKTALIGSEVHKITDVNNLLINGMNYKVIGEFINSTIESQNHTVLYCNGDIRAVPAEKVLIIDGKKKNVNRAYDYLKETIIKQGLDIEKIDIETVSLSKLVYQSNSILAVIIFAGILLFLVYLLLTVFWIHSKEQYIGVYNIIGLPNIKFKLFIRFMKLYLISYFMGSFISAKIYNSISYNFLVLLAIFLIGITIISIALFVGLKYSNNKNIKSILENDYE